MLLRGTALSLQRHERCKREPVLFEREAVQRVPQAPYVPIRRPGAESTEEADGSPGLESSTR